MNKIEEEIQKLIKKEINSQLLPSCYKIFTKEDFPDEIPPYNKLICPFEGNYAYIFPIDPNEKVKIYYFEEEL